MVLIIAIWLSVTSTALAELCAENCSDYPDLSGWSVETDATIPSDCDSHFVERCDDQPGNQPEDAELDDTDDEDYDD